MSVGACLAMVALGTGESCVGEGNPLEGCPAVRTGFRRGVQAAARCGGGGER